MAKGDACWNTVKTILGWILNTLDNTIALPPHRLTRLRTILSSVGHTQWCVALKERQHILGELCSMVLAIPAAIGLFSVLQDELKSSDVHRVRLTTHTHAFLQDLSWLVKDVGWCPTEIAEVVPDSTPATRGACDASGQGPGVSTFYPCARSNYYPCSVAAIGHPMFPDASFLAPPPRGAITNSEAQFDILAQAVDIRSHIIHNLSENSATIAWKRKGSASTSGPVA
jgi:hypothetical protein